jgi:cytosine/adenosine deaminase-related metal-dependent hydrolase
MLTCAEPAATPPTDYAAHEIFADALLTPGLLNAHAHLNYSTPSALPRGSFAHWLEAIIAQRRTPPAADWPAQLATGTAGALAQLLADGVTEVWDIASYSAGRAALQAHHLPGISFLECIGPSDSLLEVQWDRWLERWREHAALCHPPLAPGASPHAPYSVAPTLLARLGQWLQYHCIPTAMHLAESPEELEMLTTGQGPLAEVLAAAAGEGYDFDPGDGAPPITRAARAGLLGPTLLAIHANLPQPGEAGQLAATRTAVAFCPLSHAWFNYPEYPLRAYRTADVRLALGTDSLASNERLSIRAELRHVAEHWPAAADWSPTDLLALATGALLGPAPPFGGRGRLLPATPARWALWQMPPGAATTTAMPETLFFDFLQAPLLTSSALPATQLPH